MNLTRKILYLVAVFAFLTSAVPRSVSISADSLLGVSPQDEKYFKTASETVKCKDGSKTILKDQLNDDFCDCPDGSDEPGTSACPNGRFFCLNAGHTPLVIFSSRVNDGICDCCDGSDEYGGVVKCTNTCWEAGKVARDRLKKKITTYEQGVTIRKKEIDKAKLAFSEDETKLSKLKDEEKKLKDIVDHLKVHKEQIEKAEEKERLEKEKEEKARNEANTEVNKEEGKVVKSGKEEYSPGVPDDVVGHADYSSKQDVHEVNSEVELGDNPKLKESHNEELNQVKEEHHFQSGSSDESHDEEKEISKEDAETLSKEELGRLVASRWTGENTGKKNEEADSLKDEDVPEELHKDVADEEYDGYNSESEEDDERYDEKYDESVNDDFTEDHGDASSSYHSDSEDDPLLSASRNITWFEKIQKTVRSIIGAVNLFQTPVNISDAARVRKEFDECTEKLSKIQSRISSLSQKLKNDFGPEKEFYSFYDRCFESKQNKYVYKVCPFKQATQSEGYTTTRLGQWDKFEESYKVMAFSNGDKCWNGPDRSIKVRLRCGLDNEVADVDEPSRCEYVAILSTPIVCSEEKLKELQHKLEQMERPPSHDEL